MKESKLLLGFSLTTAFVFCIFAFLGQSTRPILADGALLPQPVSYSLAEATPSPAAPIAGAKTIRMACYPLRGGCTKDSDCCSGHCRTNQRASYCSNN